MRGHTTWVALLAATLVLAGCMDAGDETMDNGEPMDGDGAGTDPMEGATDMGMGEAQVTELAMARLDELPETPLAWTGHLLEPTEDTNATHTHGFAFAYAAKEGLRLVVDGTEHMLAPGEARHVPAGVPHAHPDGGWEVVLAAPDAPLPQGATLLFRSEALEGIPDAPVDARFVHVALPRGSMTAVHEHPGPEYVWVSQGTIEYQSGETGTITMTQGEDHSLPPRTSVQKRNPGEADAAFLSWFLVDPDQPFVIESSFG